MQQPLLTAVDAFLQKTGMAESALGRGAVNDWKLVRSLRAGRRLYPETEAKVRSFMDQHHATAPCGNASDASCGKRIEVSAECAE